MKKHRPRAWVRLVAFHGSQDLLFLSSFRSNGGREGTTTSEKLPILDLLAVV